MTTGVKTVTIKEYQASCLAICTEKLKGYQDIGSIKADEDKINAYSNLNSLEPPRNVITLDVDKITDEHRDRAIKCVLDGRFLAEHTAAGEATRLRLGTKYLINPGQSMSLDFCLASLSEDWHREVGESEFLEATGGVTPQDLLDLSLGQRHMLQMAFDIRKLAGQKKRNPETVLEDQWMVVVLNHKTADDILNQFRSDRFFGFVPVKVLFMIQASFNGINLKDGRFFYDPALPDRLHNHGQMAMQQTAEDQLFFLGPGGKRIHMSRNQVADVLATMDDKLSYNIEDLGYLTSAIDLDALALALDLGVKGARMVMEIVANNPIKPQKGGLAAWDSKLGRNVMIESFQLMGMPNEEIKFLNKNFNHYPQPGDAFKALAAGLPMPLGVKEGGIYFQPVQGDLNFGLETAFVQRKKLKPISNWKSAATTPSAIRAMADQDHQGGFKEFAEDTLKRSL